MTLKATLRCAIVLTLFTTSHTFPFCYFFLSEFSFNFSLDIVWYILHSVCFSDAPQVSLRLGRTLDADNIRTGHEVNFECDVKSNPPALRLEWLHNVSSFPWCPEMFFHQSSNDHELNIIMHNLANYIPIKIVTYWNTLTATIVFRLKHLSLLFYQQLKIILEYMTMEGNWKELSICKRRSVWKICAIKGMANTLINEWYMINWDELLGPEGP